MRTAIVFCGGGPARAHVDVPDDAFVVAADVGLLEANRLGVPVDLLVGDLDSVGASALASYEVAGGTVRAHPRDKDATDLALALDEAVGAGARRVLVVGGDGGRLDHVLGNALVIAGDRYSAVEVDAVLGTARLHVVRGRRELSASPGELLSLFAVGGPARGVNTTGLRWGLGDAELEPGSSLGVSNEVVADRLTIDVAAGVLLVVRPGPDDEGPP